MAQARARRRLPAGRPSSTTDGKPGVFATLDAGAPKTVGLYFMYDVKQFDPAEWTSPPLEARLVDKPGVGKVDRRPRRGQSEGAGVGVPRRAARDSRRRQEDAGEPRAWSPKARRRSARRTSASSCIAPEVEAALREMRRRVHARRPSQDLDGIVTVSLGAKGVVELELVVERREVGTRPGEGHPLLAQGDGRQPGVASGEGARHARLGRRQHDHDRQLSEAARRSAPKRRR